MLTDIALSSAMFDVTSRADVLAAYQEAQPSAAVFLSFSAAGRHSRAAEHDLSRPFLLGLRRDLRSIYAGPRRGAAAPRTAAALPAPLQRPGCLRPIQLQPRLALTNTEPNIGAAPIPTPAPRTSRCQLINIYGSFSISIN